MARRVRKGLPGCGERRPESQRSRSPRHTSFPPSSAAATGAWESGRAECGTHSIGRVCIHLGGSYGVLELWRARVVRRLTKHVLPSWPALRDFSRHPLAAPHPARSPIALPAPPCRRTTIVRPFVSPPAGRRRPPDPHVPVACGAAATATATVRRHARACGPPDGASVRAALGAGRSWASTPFDSARSRRASGGPRARVGGGLAETWAEVERGQERSRGRLMRGLFGASGTPVHARALRPTPGAPFSPFDHRLGCRVCNDGSERRAVASPRRRDRAAQ